MTPTLGQLAGLFTVPGLAAAGALAVSIPVIIHLLTRVRRRPQPWAAMRFLMEAYRKQRSRLQLEQLLLLAVRCLAVLLLGLALAGPLLGGLAGAISAGSPQRLVVLVIDDSLSAQAAPAGAASRFDNLRAQALEVLDGLHRADQVALYRAARPLEALVAPPTLDHAAVRKAIEGMQPRFARSALVDTLGEAATLIEQAGVSADRARVVVLSDFAAHTLALDRPAPTAAAQLGQRAQLLIARPSVELPNVQIATLMPRRQMILAEQRLAPTAPLEVRLRRFGSDGGDSLAALTVQVLNAHGESIASVQREHRWSAGQTDAVLNLELPLGSVQSQGPGSLSGDVMLALRGSVQSAGGVDAIAADNLAYAVVEMRQRLLVAIVGDRSELVADDGGGFDPQRWLSAALAPDEGGAIEVQRLAASALDAAALAETDAAIVVRPDLLADSGWLALRQLLSRGGLVWLAPPAEPAPAVWTANLREQLQAPWQVEIEPVSRAEDQPWTLAADSAVPEPLRLLSVDWQALLRPIRVTRHLAVRHSVAEGVWLRCDDQQPLLLAHPHEDGHLLLLTAAIAPSWSNLPTKPLFVPLLHETLRGVLGSRDGSNVIAGDAPVLGRRWGLSESLALLADDGAPAAGVNPVLLRRSDDGLMPVGALEKPGVWAGRPAGRGLRLAVNVDADAGQTRPLDERLLGEWFSRLGSWQWLEPGQATAALAVQTARANFGWPLLWVTLGLLLLETALARWFSHARVGGPGLFERTLRAVWGAR